MARAGIAVNGAHLHYAIDGDGPPCLVLPGGLGIDQVMYRRTLAPLADTFRLVYLDHRGNGRSEVVPVDTITMEQLADDAVGVADHLDLERFSVLGHSYGGFIAQELALCHPDRLDALILVDTTPGQLGTGESADGGQGPPPPPELFDLMTSVPATDEELAAQFSLLLPHYFHKLGPADVTPLFDGTIYRAAPMVRGFEVLAQWSSVDRLGSIDAPVLLLVGRHDVFTSFPQSYRIADRVGDAEVVVFEESGHFPWIEEPDRFFPIVRDWLKRNLPG